ncbi:AAA family ATPase [Nocardioides perillae]|uniref:Nuclease SbcCD subunit C n=1 Tax=Nocardioides perillae TaxID=1119534 RepID=A0A7Y9RV71_9ACTN|nr:exonuclease SbcC [Nocardioides perillae]
MRLHHLRISAFGPFAGTVEVDLDELSEAGLFLLSGPTGAGKTSVLDAVCFALYGDVPGDRAQARSLRCDRAAPEAAPRVELEATLAGRRLRLVRSPAWERPKRRGSGTTRQQASVSVSERVGEEWRPLTHRLDEAGHLVADLLGMTLTQFTQVALLPQGRFQAFLRARSEERHALLARLFRTSRFEDVERWLRERRVELRRTSEAHHRAVCDLVSRISEAAGEAVPEAWRSAGDATTLDLSGPADDDALTAWARSHLEAAERSAEAASTRVAAATEAEAVVRAAAESARQLHEHHTRLERARREQAELDAAAATAAAEVAALDAARRAAGVAPLHRRAVETTAALAAAEREAADAVGAVADGLGVLVVERDEVARLRCAAEEAVGELRAALSRAERLPVLVRRHRESTRRTDAVLREAADVAARRAGLPARLDDLERAVAAARQATTDHRAAAARVAELAARLSARRDAERLEAELARARSVWLDARQLALAAHEELLAVRQARIEGMAAEIAVGLAVGACCPVCGSDEHPRKAATAPGAPDEHAERAAQRRLDDARASEHLHDQQVRDLATRRALALARAGDASGATESTTEQLAGALAAAEAEHRTLGTAAERLPGAERAWAAAQDEATELAARAAALTTEAATLRRGAAEVADEHAALLRDLRAAAAVAGAVVPGADDGTGAGTGEDVDASATVAPPLGTAHGLVEALEHARRDQQGLVERCRRAEKALDTAAAVTRQAAAAAHAVAAAATEAGFGHGPGAVSAAVAASRAPAEVEALERSVARHRDRCAAVAAVLASPDLDDVRDLAPDALPDLDRLGHEHRLARDAVGSAREEAAAATARAERLAALATDLDDAAARWAPVRSQLSVVAGLASFCEGRSPDNRLQVRLSAYVLAHRLGQVVAAANERLARMTGRRYALEHTGRRGAGETRGGLSLLVRDDWSGETRDPATLSGGETFVVALALALGLADVIAHEAGGAELDTLFVDEGFGSLDADTLDEVLDVLDALREGGRVVGVVSHVAEVRERVPTRLEVRKDRDGSTLRTVRA